MASSRGPRTGSGVIYVRSMFLTLVHPVTTPNQTGDVRRERFSARCAGLWCRPLGLRRASLEGTI